MTPSTSGKIAFANQLRGLAVLLVVISHYTGTYWGAREVVAHYIFAPPFDGPAPVWSQAIAPTTVSYGPLGVAIFFLISGFVIPFSLEKLGALRFVSARLLRIFPTYWAASAILLLATWLSSRYWGQAFDVDAGRLLANLLLVQMQTGHPSIDLVNWTLAVEIRFYLVAMLLWPLLRRRPVLVIMGFSLVLLAYLHSIPPAWNILPATPLLRTLTATNIELMFLPFLFIGTLFHFHLAGRISGKALAGSAIAVLLIFLDLWKRTPWQAMHATAAANYSYALAIFGGCYLLRGRFKANRLFDFFADISYPLYIVHSLLGYASIRLLMAQGMGFAPAALLALALAVVVAYALHRSVELPSVALGRRWRQPPAPAGSAAAKGLRASA